MALKFPCPQCGAPNRYEEYECGTEKYCVSCQRLITVPAGDAAPSEAAAAPPALIEASAPTAVAVSEPRQSSARVFGVLDTDSLIQGKVLCPCNPDKPVEIPYRISDIAVGQVYCPRCSRAVSIGETLDRARDLSPTVPGVEVAAPQPRPGSWRRTASSVLGAAMVVAAVVAGAAWMWRDTPLVSSFLYNLGVPDDPLIKSGPPPKVVIIPVEETQLARLGLMMGATAPVGTPALFADHPRLFSKAPLAPEIRITLETIEALLKEPDAQSALITAQVWKQVLGDRQVEAADARYAALDRVIRQLEERLHPAPDPSVVVRFRELLGKIRAAVSEAQENEMRLTDAANAITEAGALLEKHPQDLALLGRVFFDLKRSYDVVEREKNGIRRIDKHLDQAEAFAQKEAGMLALEHEAKAKQLARRTPMPDKNVGDRLEARVRKLTPELQFARGKQAVVELRQCLTDGDAATRDRLAGEARTHLSHLPGSRVGALLQEVLKAEGASPRGAADSAFSKAVAFRVLFEKALESYAVDDGAKLLKYAAEAVPFASGDAQLKLAGLVFDFLDQVASDTLPLSERSPELAERFGALRSLLDQAGAWKHDPRWRKLDDPLRQRGEQVAQTALAGARKLAQKEQFDKARQELKPAIVLGDRPTRKQAEDFDKAWEQELKDRADRATQEQHWQRVMKFHADKKALDAWSELHRFTKNYPKALQQKETRDLDAELRPQVTALVAAKLREMDGWREKKSWGEFQQGYDLLKPLPLAGAEAVKVEQYGKQIDAIRRDVDGKFHLLASRNRKMATQYEVKALLIELPRILAISPGHAEAAALYEDAKHQGKVWAKKFLERIANLPLTSKLVRDIVDEIVILDCNGAIAAEAQKLVAPKKK